MIAAYMIVWIHAWYMEVDANSADIFAAAVVYSLVQVAVPIFVFLSGAFLIPNERNLSAIQFWKKSFIKLFPLSFCFFLLAFFWPSPVVSPEKLMQHSLPELFGIIVKWYAGGAGSALWFLCMLPGLYFMLPFIAKLWYKISYVGFAAISAALFVIGLASRYFEVTLPHPVSALIWLGCFMMGATLFRWAEKLNHKSIRWGVAVITIVVICSIVCRYYLFSVDRHIYEYNIRLEQPFLLVLLPSVFVVFSVWNPVPRSWVLRLSKLSFVIYMVHPPCLHVIRVILFHAGCIDRLHQGWLNNFLFSCAGCLVATVAAFVIDGVYNKMVNKLSFTTGA